VPILANFEADSNAVIERVQFSLLAQSAGAGVGGILSDREAHALFAFAPL